MSRFIISCVLILGILLHCVYSVPSAFTVTSIGKNIFNSTGVYGQWGVNTTLLYPDKSNNCRYWKQSDGLAFKATFKPGQKAKIGWIEVVADVSQLNGLGESGNKESVTLLGVRDSSFGYVGALQIVHSDSSPSGIAGMIMSNWTPSRNTTFNISSGFHTFTLGYDYDTHNVTIYVDNDYVISSVRHIFPGTYVAQYECGYGAGDEVLTRGTGKLYIKECNSFMTTIKSLYVNGEKGKDTNDGLTDKTPLKTVEAAASRAVSGTTIYISNGVYRETVSLPSGTEEGLVTVIGSGDDVLMSGAVSASDFKWTKGNDNIWVADVSSEIVKAPIFATYKNSNGEYVRVHQARTPNYRVETSWKVTEFWNTAMGGKSIMDCFGEEDCDDTDNFNTLMLADEAFKTMDDLVGARIFMSDRMSGHYYYNNTIVKHDKSKGTITTDKERLFDGLYPALGMYTQYYVYGKKSMIDAEGEYAYEDGKLYIKWSHPSLPDTLEFSVRDVGFSLDGMSYIKIENIHFMHYELGAINERAGWSTYGTDSSGYIYIEKCSFDYIMCGIKVFHGTSHASSSAHDWHINNISITHSDSSGFNFFSTANANFPNVGIVNFWVENSYFYHLGFNSEGNAGLAVGYAKYFHFLNNTVKYTSHNGLQMSYSATKDGEISTGNSLFRGNLFDQSCCGNSDCGCLKLWSPETSYIWKNVLVTENLCQNSFGWTPTSYNRNAWRDRGFGGFGYYTDGAAGPVLYRNAVYNVGEEGVTIYKRWELGTQTTVYNNLVVDAVIAMSFAGVVNEQTAQVTCKNNIYLDSSALGMNVARSKYPTPFEKFDINNNLYYRCGWSGTKYNAGVAVVRDSVNGWQIAHTFDDLHKIAPAWETTNYSFDPHYKDHPSMYNLSYDERHAVRYFDDGVFDVTEPLIDKGTSSLPQIVKDLLIFFNIKDVKTGSRYDLGPYESGVKTWIPSSKKDKDRNTFVPEEPIIISDISDSSVVSGIVSSAKASSLSIPLLLVCFFLHF